MITRTRTHILIAILVSAAPLIADPLTPQQELASFKTLPGFKVELVASEPDVVDPVAMAFDERGRLFVCEMRGYPNGGVATGAENRGRVRCLTDKDGDGVFETSTVFADGLRFPTGVLPWKGGVIVANAPDIVLLEDADGDNKSEKSRVLYTGFGLDNIQQIVNSFRWGIDDWVYAVVGNSGGTITCPDKPGMRPLVLRGRGVRFRPDVVGSIEPTTGGGQYGLTCDESGHWFTATNSQHLRQIVLPDEYLRRNPYLAVSNVTLDISEHGAACKVFRISPFEAWRVERTTRRKDSPDAKRFSPTELVPGGYITSACSPCYYGVNEPLFPKKDRGCVYVCDPANNLITRDKLVPNGSVYKGVRIDEGVEFLASTDNWFRPVHLTVGPEGALYVLDFYREVIETPLSLPDDIKKRLNLESRERGRIWRIVPEGFKAKAFPRIEAEKRKELVGSLLSKHEWIRATARRIVAEDKPNETLEDLLKWRLYLPQDGSGKLLGAIRTFDKLTARDVEDVLKNGDANDRVQALRLAGPFLGANPDLENQILNAEHVESSFVRFQLALTAGELHPRWSTPLLSRLLRHPEADVWLKTAALSSARDAAPGLLKDLADDPVFSKDPAVLGQLAAMAGARGTDADTLAVVTVLARAKTLAVQRAILEGLGDGMRSRDGSLGQWLATSAGKPALATVAPFFRQAADTAGDERAKPAARVAAVRLLGFGPFDLVGEPLAGLLSPRSPAEVQAAALRALAGFPNPQVGPHLLAAWDGYSPDLRREATEAIFARPDRLTALFDAIESKKVAANQIEAARADVLRKHPDATIRARAAKLLAGQVTADRKKVLDDYQAALALKGDAIRGREVFRKNCTACHRLDGAGNEVGANLVAALRNKTKEALLLDILDPSREVDPRFVNYQVTTTTGRLVSGLLAVETPTSLTLRRGDKAEDTILRSQVEEVRATSKSLMPEEFEKVIDRQAMADLIGYLLSVP
ncbi:MAG TPA: PVC-type heme-binding CxxCH protein [Gemmataceae bacterium]|nr:PVC-type heme-binding CxxCH protein [Gemmataceae bacterium]